MPEDPKDRSQRVDTIVTPDGAPSARSALDDAAFAATLAGDAPAPEAVAPKSKHLLTILRSTVIPTAKRDDGLLRLEAREVPRYQATQVLGRGGMGEVLLAKDDDIGRTVAVKRTLTNSPELLARFADEIRFMGQLEHPNIAGVYDVDVDSEGRLFFTMRYVAGEALSDIIARLAQRDPATLARYPLARRIDIFIDIMSALAHAHEAGVMHRDVKPDNVMVGANGDVVLTDWGIARDLEAEFEETADVATASDDRSRAANTGVGGVIGTPLYMSPEQAAGQPVDARADIYSAFALLFELLTLRSYVDADQSLAEMLAASTTREPPGVYAPVYSEAAGQPAVPAELRHFLIRGLRNNRDERFASASEAITYLSLLRSGQIPIKCPVTLIKYTQGTTVRMMEKFPRVAVALWSLTMVGIVAGVITFLVT
ncbi:MAG: serine/threonine-protein kinase [Polyangiales bacterium]